jgi:RNA polymerase sigma-70 factor (ECF subfamily)
LRPAIRATLARRGRAWNEIDDIVQETLLRAARYRHSLADPERLKPWVLRIALNVMRDSARRELRLPRIERGEELFEQNVVLQHLSESLEAMSPIDRSVLDLFYSSEEGTRTTAAVCELPPVLVKVKVYRARRRLTRTLRRRLSLDAEGDAKSLLESHELRSARCAPVPMTRVRGNPKAAPMEP